MNRRCCVLLLIIGTLVACGGREAVPVAIPQKVAPEPPAPPPVDPEVALKERVTKFWNARLKGDIASLYDFLDPETKERVTLTGYILSQGSFRFLSYQVQTLDIVGEKAWVNVSYGFKMTIPALAGFGPWTQESPELWILRDGTWYRPYDQKEAQAPPPGVRQPQKILLDKPIQKLYKGRESTGQ